MTNQDAYLLRENTGTSGVLETARTAAAVRADWDVPHLVVDGIAVQEHGSLPRDLSVAETVRTAYEEIWDALKAES